jgi:Rhodopirellula transposase DDE domain
MLTEQLKATFKDAAKKLTGHKKRDFMAKVAEDYFEGSARKTETEMGWNRQSVQLGLHERRSGLVCVDNTTARGRHKSEEERPTLEADIRELVEGQAQVDPKFQSTFLYSRISAKAVREALIEQKGYEEEELPTRQTIGEILNRLGYRLKKTQKTKPWKKIPETDAIFENVARENQAADEDPQVLRLSIDTKAKVKIGNLSREGKDRGLEAKQADDHDTQWESVLVPFGILNLETNQLSIYFGQSAETSDFIVDCLEAWWQEHQGVYSHINQLAIDVDGGSATRSDRTQLIKRLVEFAQTTGLRIRLIYYPPYHSKYNPIERCWAALENYWNGAILNSVEAALQWATNMTWKGIQPIVHLVSTTYQTGVKVLPEVLEHYKRFWHRSETLPKWDVTVVPS